MKRFLNFFLFLVFVQSINAQDTIVNPTRSIFTSSFQIQPTQGYFSDKFDASPFGGSLEFYLPLKKKYLWLGLGMDFVTLDKESIKFNQIIAGFDREYELKTTTSKMLIKGIFRFQPQIQKRMVPYAKASLGTQRILTETNLLDKDLENRSIESEKHNVDWNLNLGLVAGVTLGLRKGFIGGLDFGIGYQWGNHTNAFVRQDGVTPLEFPIEAFTLDQARLNFFVMKFGVIFNIRESARTRYYRERYQQEKKPKSHNI